MEQIYQQQLIISPSIADAAGRLSVQDAFGLFMDAASVHAELLGSGLDAMAQKNLFWLTVKTQLHFYERPRIMERVAVRTWPEAPGRLRCNRSYQLVRGDEVLIAGKTEWAVMNTKTNQLVPAAGVYPAELSFDAPSACPEPFARIPDSFAEADRYAKYRVRSTDIDVGRHMNNVAYVRALLGSFSNRELAGRAIRRMDVSFRSPCFEGELLHLARRVSDAGLDLRIEKDDGATALLARIESDA